MAKDVFDMVPRAKRERRTYNVTDEQFVAAWSLSSSIDEVSRRIKETTGVSMESSIVSSRAAYYRRAGVALKSLRGDGTKPRFTPEYLARLNKVADSHLRLR